MNTFGVLTFGDNNQPDHSCLAFPQKSSQIERARIPEPVTPSFAP